MALKRDGGVSPKRSNSATQRSLNSATQRSPKRSNSATYRHDAGSQRLPRATSEQDWAVNALAHMASCNRPATPTGLSKSRSSPQLGLGSKLGGENFGSHRHAGDPIARTLAKRNQGRNTPSQQAATTDLPEISHDGLTENSEDTIRPMTLTKPTQRKSRFPPLDPLEPVKAYASENSAYSPSLISTRCPSSPENSPTTSRKVSKEQGALPKKARPPLSLAICAHRWSIPLESMKNSARIFRKHATKGSFLENDDILHHGFLDQESMLKVACDLCSVDSENDMSKDAKQVFGLADQNGDGIISFQEFAVWYNARAFTEFMTMDEHELETAALARKLELSAFQMETYKAMYDKFDEGGTGDIEFDEFRELMHVCMRCPRQTHGGTLRIPETRIDSFWRECDADGSGGVDLEEFINFYRHHFDSDAADPLTIDQYYKGIRRGSYSQLPNLR